MTLRRQLGAALAMGAVLVIATAVSLPSRISDALFSDAQAVTDNTFTSGTWSVLTYYLHNNPTPPVGDTNVQANLLMDDVEPTASTLYNYDTNADSAAGRYVAKGGSGTTTDLVKYQNWRTAALADPLVIDGMIELEFWSAIKDFGTGKAGDVGAFLRDFNPATSAYTEIGNATLAVSNWQGGSSTWVVNTISISVSNYTLQAGRQLDVRLVVGGSSGDDMWFAYDTASYASELRIP